jgi:hypothetical protein
LKDLLSFDFTSRKVMVMKRGKEKKRLMMKLRRKERTRVRQLLVQMMFRPSWTLFPQ